MSRDVRFYPQILFVDSEEIFTLNAKIHIKPRYYQPNRKQWRYRSSIRQRYASFRVRFVVVVIAAQMRDARFYVHTFDAFKFLWANKLPHLPRFRTVMEYISQSICQSGNYYCTSCSLRQDSNSNFLTQYNFIRISRLLLKFVIIYLKYNMIQDTSCRVKMRFFDKLRINIFLIKKNKCHLIF